MKNLSDIAENLSLKIYKFGNCSLNTVERKVLKGERILDISSRAFDILQLLVERQGKVVSKDEILDAVWSDSFVEEGNLTVHVSKLRKLLGANKTEPFIETVSGVGYRFVSRVSVVHENEFESARLIETKLTVNNLDHNSIAVLPLDNENGDEEIDYLTDGITESLINNLSYLPNLRVISRNTVFRYKNKNIDIQKVGKELGVSNILTGRIRIIRDNLTLSVELTNSEDNNQLWGTQINQPFEDIFEVQEKITQSISEKLKTQISDKPNGLSTQTISQNPESYRLYLKGKYFLNNRSFENVNKAIKCFQTSISIDPTNVLSYIELAYSNKLLYLFEIITHKKALSKITTLLAQAIEINPSVAEVHLLKGNLKFFMEFDINEAEKNFQIALSLNPNLVDVLFQYAQLRAYSGKFSEAQKRIKEILRLDPISLVTNKFIAKIFYATEQYENAIMKLEECLEMKPLDFETLLLLGANHSEIANYNEALNSFYQALEIQFHTETLSMIGYTYAHAGMFKEAEDILKQLKNNFKDKYVPATYFGIIYSALGEKDKTFEYLEKAFEDKYSDLMALKIDPRYKPIRDDSRFNEILLKIGLPTN